MRSVTAGNRGPSASACCVDAEEIEIVVRDDGSGMAPRHDSPGLGLGLPLIRRVADGFDHRMPPDGGTELWMRFVL
jgi:anti-sigma regulatory factor (Ser/Thr protein kinase)